MYKKYTKLAKPVSTADFGKIVRQVFPQVSWVILLLLWIELSFFMYMAFVGIDRLVLCEREIRCRLVRV